MLLLSFADFFKSTFSKKILDLDWHPYSVGPDLGPSCLQRLSADE